MNIKHSAWTGMVSLVGWSYGAELAHLVRTDRRRRPGAESGSTPAPVDPNDANQPLIDLLTAKLH